MKKIVVILIFSLMFSFIFLTSIYTQEEKTFLEKADEYFEKGKFSLAEIFYNKAVQEHPDNFNANYNLGKIYYYQKSYKKSLKYLQMAYDLKPDKEIMFHIANCYVHDKKPKKALSIYSNLLRIDPGYADIHLNAGNIGLKQLYNKHLTIGHWEKFLELRPNDPQAPNIRKALGYLRDPNFVLKPPAGQDTESSEHITGTSTGVDRLSDATSGTNTEGMEMLLPDIKGKDLKSESEEKYKLKNKKTITTD